MARVRSLGVHEPSALDYLVREGLLDKDPRPSDYHWQTYTVYAGQDDASVEEEILRTERCVVWSRGGVVKRTFGQDIEGESILDAFVTGFAQDRYTGLKPAENDGDSTQYYQFGLQAADSTATQTSGSYSTSALHRALVVVLHTQVHIYFLAGDTHVVPLPFEVETALPAPTGFVLQRRAARRGNAVVVPSVPPNSFASPILEGPHATSNFSFSQSRGLRPSLATSTAPAHRTNPSELESADTPCLFYLLDPRAEVGMVTAASNTFHRPGRHSPTNHGLNPNENIVYLSIKDELRRGDAADHPLFLAVTCNSKSNTYTVWNVDYDIQPDRPGPTSKRRRVDSSAVSRRRSSNVFGLNTGAATPGARGHISLRDSAAGLPSSLRENQDKENSEDSKAPDLENLASQLGPEFGEIGVQTRAARRVSSMLARTDLATNQDRSNFHDIATGHHTRSSTGRALRRGESIGGYSDRTSFGPGRRSSLYGNGSILSQGSSFLDTPVDQLLQNLNDNGDIRGFEDINLQGSNSNLQKEMLFTKIQDVPRTRSLHISNKQQGASSRVFTMLSPKKRASNGSNPGVEIVSVCMVQRDSQEIIVLSIQASYSSASKQTGKDAHKDDSHSKASKRNVSLKPLDIRRGSNILDACKIEDDPISRMLLLTETRDGSSILNIEAPWGSSFRLDLPKQFKVHDPFSVMPDALPLRRRDGSIKRVISDPLDSFRGLANFSSRARVDLVDKEAKKHRLEISMKPSDDRVDRILRVADYVLQDHCGDGLLTVWWEILRWLRSNGHTVHDEWTAIVVALFCMAVPFIAAKQQRRSVEPKRKKPGPRLSGPRAAPGDSWQSVSDHETDPVSRETVWHISSSWFWTVGPGATSEKGDLPKGNVFLIHCIDLARDFLQSPAGEAAHGPEGSLPTAISRPLEVRRTSLATLLVGVHLLLEEDKLNTNASSSPTAELKALVPVLAQIGHWLGWKSWSWKDDTYYATDVNVVDSWEFEDTQISLLDVPVQPFEPPSVYAHFEGWLKGGVTSQFLNLPRVAGLDQTTPAFAQEASSHTPRIHLLNQILDCLAKERDSYGKVQTLAEIRFTQELLASMPESFKALIHEVLAQTQSDPPTSWLEDALKLVDRDDLLLTKSYQGALTPAPKVHVLPHHEAIRDYHSIGNTTLETEPYHFFDSSAEADRQLVTRLIYHEDRRFQDAAKLVNQLRPPVAECISEPDWTESDLLEAQKDLVQLVTLRTLAVSSGRGMMNFNSRIPLLTDKVPIPAFTLQCLMRPMNVTFSADRAAFTEEKVCWAFFHNGVSTGLTISKAARGIDTSWILFNKPPELTNRHAGFLLGLGLNGHLQALAKWVAFKYLTPKHTMVSIGLLLGLSASYLGTMDTLITRLLSVHVTRMLPPGAAELNLSPLTQTAGIMGIGLLYANSQHRRMSEIMVSEIENTDIEESPQNILRDEGYRLAAGFALGMINLGKGRNLRGVHDMNLVERLLSLAVGTKNVNLVHVLDRATAGATVATALIFLKTNNETIARKIDVPDTLHQFDYVRPDIFLLRTVARHLIMWSAIDATEGWISRSLPEAYRNRASLASVTRLSSEDMPFFNILAGLCLSLGLRYAGSASPQVRDLLVHYLDQFIRLTRLSAMNYDAKLTKNSVRNCQDVVCLAVSAVMAGTGDLNVFRRLRSLHGRIDSDTPYGSHLAAHMAIGSLFLGGGTHTFATSDIAVAALLCAFYPIFPTFVLDNKAHLQAFRHFWVLAAEPRCLIPREVSTQRPINVLLSITLKSGTTGRLTAPCLLPPTSTISTIRTMAPDYWTVTLDFTNVTMLPASFRASQSIFLRRRSPYDAVSSSPSSVFVSALQAHADADPTPSVSATASATTMASARAMQNASGSVGPPGGSFAFDWMFSLASFEDFDVAEKALILPLAGATTTSTSGLSKTGILKGSVMDTRLALEKGVLPHNTEAARGDPTRYDPRGRLTVDKNKLWQLRLLFAWTERLDKEATFNEGKSTSPNENSPDGDGMWLRRQVIERLRWRVWRLGNSVSDEYDVDEERNISNDGAIAADNHGMHTNV